MISLGISKTDRDARDDKSLIDSLNEQIRTLKSQNSTLALKNKEFSDQLEKKKKELLVAKRPTATIKRTSTAPTNQEVEVVAGPSSRSNMKIDHDTDSNWFEIAKKLKARYKHIQYIL